MVNVEIFAEINKINVHILDACTYLLEFLSLLTKSKSLVMKIVFFYLHEELKFMLLLKPAKLAFNTVKS